MESDQEQYMHDYNTTLEQNNRKKVHLENAKRCLDVEIAENENIIKDKNEYIDRLRVRVIQEQIGKKKVEILYENALKKLPILEHGLYNLMQLVNLMEGKLNILRKINRERYEICVNAAKHNDIHYQMRKKLEKDQTKIQNLLQIVREFGKESHDSKIESLLNDCINHYKSAIAIRKKNNEMSEELSSLRKNYEDKVSLLNKNIMDLEYKESMKANKQEGLNENGYSQSSEDEHNTALLQLENLKIQEEISRKYKKILLNTILSREQLGNICKNWKNEQNLIYATLQNKNLKNDLDNLEKSLKESQQEKDNINHAYNHLFKMQKNSLKKKAALNSHVEVEEDAEKMDYLSNGNFDSDYPRGKSSGGQLKTNGRPCRACTDFKTWIKLQKGNGSEFKGDSNDQCPLDKDELGSKSWAFLHTMAAYYPDKPSSDVQVDMKQFFKLFSKFYPCTHCAEDFAQYIAETPPDTSSRGNLTQWLCVAHNAVNKKIGKPEFDCSLVDQRWWTGWTNGSCG